MINPPGVNEYRSSGETPDIDSEWRRIRLFLICAVMYKDIESKLVVLPSFPSSTLCRVLAKPNAPLIWFTVSF